MSVKIHNMRDVWSDQSTDYTSVKMNVFDVSSDVNSKLIDLKLNGISQFTVNKLGEIVFGSLDIQRVNSLEETINALTASGLSKVDQIFPTRSALELDLEYAADTIALVFQDPDIDNNDWYVKTGVSGEGSWTKTGLIPELATFLVPRKQISRTIYVAMDGNDDNDGRSLYKPVQTVNQALLIANTVVNTPGEGPCAVIVHPGEYEVEPFTEIPQNTLLYGYDLRVTKLKIADGFANTNMFLLNSGIKVRGFSFTGLQHETTWAGTAENSNGSLDFGPPKFGYAFAFKPDVIITRSPYIADCTVIHSNDYTTMSLPQDRQQGNPLMPLGMGNLYADGSVCNPNSPLRSVVVDSFTSVNPNGVAYSIVNNAIVQLVSVFTNWSRVGIWAHRGGQVTIVNSNATFGDYAFASTGFRYQIAVTRLDETVKVASLSTVGEYIANNITSITDTLMDTRYPTNVTDWNTTISNNPTRLEQTERDTITILTELAQDLRADKLYFPPSDPTNPRVSADDDGLLFWLQGLFDTDPTGDFQANTVFVFDESLVPQFTESFAEIRDELKNLTVSIPSSEPEANAFLDAYFAKAIDVLENPMDYTLTFKSTIEAASHQFSYAGTGVNYNALPSAQRGSGKTPDPSTQLYTSNGGVIYSTFNTENGDTYLGQDLRIDFERSVIEGQAFSRGVQNIVLPLIIGIGG